MSPKSAENSAKLGSVEPTLTLVGPLYPQKQTSAERIGMSALCQKQTLCSAAIGGRNAFAYAASTCRSTMTGRVKIKVDPWPGCDSTQIRPPCISMMRFDIASPKPVPPFLRVMALSAC
jgi:hypothetical protein